MAKIYDEKMLENIISKLKENVTNWEGTMLPVNKKIDNLFQITHEMMSKNEADQETKRTLYLILSELQNIRDFYNHNISTLTKNYDTYLYFLELLYERDKGAGESAKMVKEAHSETDTEGQGHQFLSHQVSNDLPVVTDKKPKVKSELLRFP